MKRIGLLRMCELSEPAIAAHGDYVTVFRDFYAAHPVEIVDVPVHEGATPASIDDCDAWVISGSPASTYDDLPWIATGEEIVRSIVAAERPLFGICFGHQLMAQALGGTVERAEVGWGAGAHHYDVVEQPAATGALLPDRLTVLAMHQDQVTRAPDEGEVWLRSEFCPNAGIAYGERAWSIQPHPEFTPRLVEALCRDRRLRMGDEVADAAIASLSAPLDGHLLADADVCRSTVAH